jgi:hypothetical protein
MDMDRWRFFFAADSGDHFPTVLLLALVFSALFAVFTYFEHRARGKWAWIAANAVLVTAAAAVLLGLGAGLSELLLYLLLFLFIRLCFAFREGRDKT